VDARNELDSAAYQVERRLGDLGGAVAEHERARAEMLVADARQAVKEEAPINRLRSLTGELQQIYHALGAAPAGGAGGPAGGGQEPRGGQGQGSGQGGDDDVIDAEFTTG
jgi:molecular chaperone DnaK